MGITSDYDGHILYFAPCCMYARHGSSYGVGPETCTPGEPSGERRRSQWLQMSYQDEEIRVTRGRDGPG
jgi:hypothetical protein